MTFGLDRFKDEQGKARNGYEAALGQIRSGQKTGHWIWYILPQLQELGMSSTAVRFGIAGVEEAKAYLRDDVLRRRLRETVAAVREQLEAGVRVRALMGSDVDALKLVSCLTLFEPLARDLAEEEPGRAAELAPLADDAAAVLEIAAQQALRRCPVTLARLVEAGLAAP